LFNVDQQAYRDLLTDYEADEASTGNPDESISTEDEPPP
jgi:hypothetical protein